MTPPKYEQETEAPMLSDGSYLYERHATVWTPFIRAAITGLLVALPVVYWLYHYWADLNEALFRGTISGFAVALAVWWMGLQLWERQWQKIISLAERVSNVDIDGDGVIGETNHRVNVDLRTINQDGQDITTRATFDIDDDRLSVFAAALLAGRSMSQPEWTGAGKPFSKREHSAIIEEMLLRGIIEPRSEKDARQGYRVTKAGRAALRAISGSPTPSEPFAR